MPRGRVIPALAALVCLAVVVVLGNRLDPSSTLPFAATLVGGAGLIVPLTVAVQRLLRTPRSPSSAAAYRWALLIGFVVGGSALMLTPPTLPPPLAAIGWAAAAAAAFGGGLVASAREFGLWEDNAPPPREVVEEVQSRHRRRLGGDVRLPPGKRLLDLLGSGLALVVAGPPGLALLLALWLEDPGPLFFVKNSVGQGGRSFRQWKVRTMVRGAETESGPVWAEKEDPRVLVVGRFLRRTALDELPQLINILSGQMSLVGPRPQRTVLVSGYLRDLPEYAERHRLPPGLAGLAQVAGHYYLTPRQKLRFDRLYLEYAGLGFDLRLILIAFAVVFWLRWKPGWRGRIPRSWLHRRAIRRGALSRLPGSADATETMRSTAPPPESPR